MNEIALTQFRDIKGPEAIDSVAQSWQIGWWITFAIMALAFFSGLLIAWRRRRKPDHHALALQQLEQIESELEQDSKRANIEIARLIRDCVTRTFSIPAYALTAEQIAQAMSQQAVAQHTVDSTLRLLRTTDQMKFAGPDRDDRRSLRSLFDETRTIVGLISAKTNIRNRRSNPQAAPDSPK